VLDEVGIPWSIARTLTLDIRKSSLLTTSIKLQALVSNGPNKHPNAPCKIHEQKSTWTGQSSFRIYNRSLCMSRVEILPLLDREYVSTILLEIDLVRNLPSKKLTVSLPYTSSWPHSCGCYRHGATRKLPPTVSNIAKKIPGKSQHDLSNADQPFLNSLYDPQDPQLWADWIKTTSVSYLMVIELDGVEQRPNGLFHALQPSQALQLLPRPERRAEHLYEESGRKHTDTTNFRNT